MIVPPDEARAFVLRLVNERGIATVRLWHGIGAYSAAANDEHGWSVVWGLIGDPNFEDRWHYATRRAALTALRTWQMDQGHEPQGWLWHPKSQRGVQPRGR